MQKSKNYISILALISLLFFASEASAQLQPGGATDQMTKEVDRAIPEEEIERKLTPPPKEAPPIEKEVEEEEEVEEVKFFAKEIKLVGIETFPEEDFRPLVEKYENREVSLSELKVLAREIEREYLKKGVIAVCFVPPQDIKEGVVTLQVVEGKMGDLEIREHKYFFKHRLAYYWNIKKGDVLRHDKIARSLQLMNKNPDRLVKGTLHAGKAPGTTDIILSALTVFPMHFTASLDREGAPSSGRWRRGFGFVNNNFMGLDDTLMFGYKGGKHFAGTYIYHRLPLTNFGTSTVYGYSKTRGFTKKDLSTFELSSSSESASISLHQDLYEKNEYRGEVKFGLEMTDKTTHSHAVTIIRDRLGIVRTGGLYLKRGMGSIVFLRPEFSQGLNYLFGARRENEFSSRSASNTFSKCTLEAGYKQALIYGLQASLNFKGQLAGEKLPPSEELSMGGIDSVRGYPAGDFLTDNGYYANLELLVPSALLLPEKFEEFKLPYGARPLSREVTGVLFFDFGYGSKKSPLVTEPDDQKFASVGAGLRIRLFNQGTLRLEWAVPLETMADLPETEFSRQRFHFAFDFQGMFPEEMERLYDELEANNIKEYAWRALNNEMKERESPLKKKIHRHLYLARKACGGKDLNSARKHYLKLATISNSLHKQLEDYIKEDAGGREDREKLAELAREYFQEAEKAGKDESITEETPPYALSLKSIVKEADRNLKRIDKKLRKETREKPSEEGPESEV